MKNNLKLTVINYLWHLPFSFYSNLRYGFPSGGLEVIGVTGTDGKTTTVSMIYHILHNSGFSVGMISTISAKLEGEDFDIGLHVTTPAHPSFSDFVKALGHLDLKKLINMILYPESIHKYLSLLKSRGAKYVVIETTSQGLFQFRLYGVKFKQAIYTNIGNDHIDYHGDWQSYAVAKASLIGLLTDDGLAIINGDDKSKDLLIDVARSKHRDVSIYSRSDISDYSYTNRGLAFTYKQTHYEVPIIGEYNIENLMAAISCCLKYLDGSEVSKSLSNFKTPKGRMEIMQSEPFLVIVDFAHTPGALKQALESLDKLKDNSKQRLITVFGCAGKRDKGRRDMGRLSFDSADVTILTAEDPRDEKLIDINKEIVERIKSTSRSFSEDWNKEESMSVEAMPDVRQAQRRLEESRPVETQRRLEESRPVETQRRLEESRPVEASAQTGRKNHEVNYSIININNHKEYLSLDLKNASANIFAFNENSVQSRKDAIEFALNIARPGDIVYITGKGHEQSLAFGFEEIEWSDQEVVREILERMKKVER